MELRERLLSVHRFDGVITRVQTATITDQAPAFIKGIPQRHRGIGQGGADIAVDIVNFTQSHPGIDVKNRAFHGIKKR